MRYERRLRCRERGGVIRNQMLDEALGGLDCRGVWVVGGVPRRKSQGEVGVGATGTGLGTTSPELPDSHHVSIIRNQTR